jgi:hypothetical protein
MITGKILVVCNDSPMILCSPADIRALLETSLPECGVEALVPQYTRELAEQYPWIG